jgi:hypothetical protein
LSSVRRSWLGVEAYRARMEQDAPDAETAEQPHQGLLA